MNAIQRATAGHRYCEYLGDGVYASFDGYQMWLHTERDGGVASIALERPLPDQVADYMARVVKAATAGATVLPASTRRF